MTRRRPPRRPRRRPLRRAVRRAVRRQAAPVPPGARRALADAHRAMEAGDFARAAQIYGAECDKARDRGQPGAAAKLALQAARAHLQAEDVTATLERGKMALRLMARSGRLGRVPIVLNRMVDQLREKGYEAEADQLKAEVEAKLAEAGISLEEAAQRATAPASQQRGQLPGKCTACAGPLNPNDVEWFDAHTAECPYCGSVVKAE